MSVSPGSEEKALHHDATRAHQDRQGDCEFDKFQSTAGSSQVAPIEIQDLEANEYQAHGSWPCMFGLHAECLLKASSCDDTLLHTCVQIRPSQDPMQLNT
jgi:hypothetical protein